MDRVGLVWAGLAFKPLIALALFALVIIPLRLLIIRLVPRRVAFRLLRDVSIGKRAAVIAAVWFLIVCYTWSIGL